MADKNIKTGVKKTKEVVDKTEDKVELSKEEPIKEKPVKKKLNKSQISNLLKKHENDINVEVLNIGIGSVLYMNKMGQTYFDLELGESEIVSLGMIKEVCGRSMGFFKDFAITITNIFLEDVEGITNQDVITYLGLDRVFKDVEGYDTDFVKEFVLNSDEQEFEKELKKKGRKFTKMIACKMIQLYQDGEDIDRNKEIIVKDLLELESLKFR